MLLTRRLAVGGLDDRLRVARCVSDSATPLRVVAGSLLIPRREGLPPEFRWEVELHLGRRNRAATVLCSGPRARLLWRDRGCEIWHPSQARPRH